MLAGRLARRASVVWIVGAALALTNPVCSQQDPAPSTTAPQSNSARDIPQLIQRLNSQRYADREQASQTLIELGSVALRPLAKNYFESSPECMWRTRRILEEIGVAGDEVTFFRAAALLRLICIEQDIAHRLQQHYRRWQQMQTERAAERLRSLGATVHLMEQNSEQMLGREILVFLQPEWDVRGVPTPNETGPAKLKTAGPPPPSPPSEQQLIKRIDQILVASIDQNRQFAFEANDVIAAVESPMGASQFHIGFGQEQAIVLADGRMVYSEQYFPGSQVAIDQHWRGNAEDFALVAAIENLSGVRFISGQVSSDELLVLNRLSTLRSVHLTSCELDEAAWQTLAQNPQLVQVVVDSVKIDGTAMAALAAIPQLATLKLANTPFTRDALDSLSRATGLAVLILENVQLRAEHVEAILQMRTVMQLQLTSCKFSLDDYRRFVGRPGIEVNVIGNALLGIREARLPSSQSPESCQVGEVVSGSGADVAGIQVGDCIVRINDQAIASFRELVAVVSQFQPGDQIDLAVRRGAQLVELRATLGARN